MRADIGIGIDGDATACHLDEKGRIARRRSIMASWRSWHRRGLWREAAWSRPSVELGLGHA